MRHAFRERGSFLTPGGKLRARPCSGPSALLYEPLPSSAQLHRLPDSFTGYVRQNIPATDAAIGCEPATHRRPRWMSDRVRRRDTGLLGPTSLGYM